jgi:metal-responsive CopG/Arc/MetJ family transcriptional regulator
MEKIARVSAGVKFESDVLAFIDGLARENQRSRSFMINAIIRWYLRQHKELTKVEAEDRVPVIRL